MRSSLPSSFAKFFLICGFAILAASSAFGQTALGFTQAPNHVSVSPEGCRNNGGITLQNNSQAMLRTRAATLARTGRNWILFRLNSRPQARAIAPPQFTTSLSRAITSRVAAPVMTSSPCPSLIQT